MEEYIKKSALVAEIDKEIQDRTPRQRNHYDGYMEGYLDALESFKEYIDTLDVIEVNEVPATVMVNKYGNRFISSWSGLKEYDGLKEGEEIKILITKK
jgi:hypothetical protein